VEKSLYFNPKTNPFVIYDACISVIFSKSYPGCPARHKWHTPPPPRFDAAAFGPLLKVRVSLPALALVAKGMAGYPLRDQFIHTHICRKKNQSNN